MECGSGHQNPTPDMVFVDISPYDDRFCGVVVYGQSLWELNNWSNGIHAWVACHWHTSRCPSSSCAIAVVLWLGFGLTLAFLRKNETLDTLRDPRARWLPASWHASNSESETLKQIRNIVRVDIDQLALAIKQQDSFVFGYQQLKILIKTYQPQNQIWLLSVLYKSHYAIYCSTVENILKNSIRYDGKLYKYFYKKYHLTILNINWNQNNVDWFNNSYINIILINKYSFLCDHGFLKKKITSL